MQPWRDRGYEPPLPRTSLWWTPHEVGPADTASNRAQEPWIEGELETVPLNMSHKMYYVSKLTFLSFNLSSKTSRFGPPVEIPVEKLPGNARPYGKAQCQ